VRRGVIGALVAGDPHDLRDTSHPPVATTVTSRPELALGLMGKVSPNCAGVVGWTKVIVCAFLVTATVRATSLAAE